MSNKPEQYEILEAIMILAKLLDGYHVSRLIEFLYTIQDDKLAEEKE